MIIYNRFGIKYALVIEREHLQIKVFRKHFLIVCYLRQLNFNILNIEVSCNIQLSEKKFTKMNKAFQKLNNETFYEVLILKAI